MRRDITRKEFKAMSIPDQLLYFALYDQLVSHPDEHFPHPRRVLWFSRDTGDEEVYNLYEYVFLKSENYEEKKEQLKNHILKLKNNT